MAILNNTTVNGLLQVNGDLTNNNIMTDASHSKLYIYRINDSGCDTDPNINSQNPKIVFGVPNYGQDVGIAWSDFDTALGGKGKPAGLHLVGQQGNEYFTAPRLYEGTSRVLTESITDNINLNSHSLLNSSSVQFTGTAISAQDNIPTALSYGKLQAYGTFNILGNTDASGDEYVNIMAGYKVTNLGNVNTNGLSVGNTTLKWKGNQLATESWVSTTATAYNAGLLDGHDSSYFATAISLNNYLLLTGGTMSGQILFSGNDNQQGIMPSANNFGYIGNSSTKWMEIHGVTINADHFTSSSATSATGTNAISLGLSTIASGHYSFALGNSTQATVANTVSFGTNSKATGPNAFAHGNDTLASGRSSHAEGTQCRATKDYAHAEGNTTEALAMNSHAEGVGTKTTAPGQHAEGKYNVENPNALLMVGNGARNARSTAFEVLEDGRAKVQTAPIDADDVVRKQELDTKQNTLTAGYGINITDNTISNSISGLLTGSYNSSTHVLTITIN